MKEIITLIEQTVRTMNEEEKGGVEKKATAPKSVDNLGLDLAEIANILVTGTETDKILESSDAALKTLMAGGDINIDLSSAQSLVDSFSFLDFKSQEVLNERCSSLGGLVSKIALASGLISILQQFNAVSAGFVNEAYIATLMGGESVPVGDGGIEDIVVGDVGISLKVKATETLGGSFGNLLETLSIPYVINKQVRTIRPETKFENVDGKRYVIPPADPVNPGGLYYLTFIKQTDGMTVAAYKITREDIIGSAKPDKNGFYKIEDLNNVLKSKSPNVKEKASYKMETTLTPQSFNEVLRSEMAEVFESLSVLDAWYGQMKQKIVGYISTLEKSSFDELQNHLNSGSEFNFKAFSTNSCPDNMMQENKNNSLSELELLMEQVVREIIS
jgi:hypothetical protein